MTTHRSALATQLNVLAAHVRDLDDGHLNDLLVELPRERFSELLDAAFATPQVDVPVRYHPARPHTGEATRWTVEAHRLLNQPGMLHAPMPAWTLLGAVTQRPAAGPRGGTRPVWHATTRDGQPISDPDGGGWPTRTRAVAALLWHCPASGARCQALAAHVRTLADDALNDLLAELPPRRFAALLLAALDTARDGGVAA
jgi:hypothetical protein